MVTHTREFDFEIYTWIYEILRFLAFLMFMGWRMVPKVVPKHIKSKSMMFGDSKTVLKLFLGCFIDFLHIFQIWSFLDRKSHFFGSWISNFRIGYHFGYHRVSFPKVSSSNSFSKKMSAITHLPRWSALHFVFSPKFANIAIPHILICGSSIEYSTTSKIFGIKRMHSQLSNALSDVFIAYLDAEIYSFEVAKFLQSPAFQDVFILALIS